ncbi:inositol monophosphatase family protein [Gulosibacter sp. 10]|uniref:inositol monophosphatase family protein n=1 Tax=Gulosibacter sp. 10 TaxID=1255570 RepID=UPI00097EB625|nr:inositol monophosphatase family protein [Gulosibacter sp. 10]SJM57424.1 Histidinol-phosphatase [alternative form] [Gulosibacter sp. 10]
MAVELLHPITADLRLARQLADIADEISMDYFRRRDLGVYVKEDRTHVTDGDRNVEQALRAKLAEERPSDSVFGEEYGSEGNSRRQWIIDPIDGTANFMRGVPIWATLISLVIDGRPEVGVVSAPALNRRWWGATGHGAYLDDDLADSDTATDRRIHVSGVETLEDGQLSYGSMQYWMEIDRLEPIVELNDRMWRSRSIGDFWPYMLVAEGSFEVACEVGLQPYDMAALIPVIEEAGGQFTSIEGKEGPWHGSALATNANVHEAALEVFHRA